MRNGYQGQSDSAENRSQNHHRPGHSKGVVEPHQGDDPKETHEDDQPGSSEEQTAGSSDGLGAREASDSIAALLACRSCSTSLLLQAGQMEVGRITPVDRDAVQDLNHMLRNLESRLPRFAETLRSQEETAASDSIDAEQLGQLRQAFNKLMRGFE